MAKAKFTYDENGATYYFILSFLSLILIPSTYYLWSDDDEQAEEKNNKANCKCNQCRAKRRQLESQNKWKKSRRKLIRSIIILGWLLFIAIVYKIKSIDTEYINFDPYEILGVDENTSLNDTKRAYRKLSLLYHPDKYDGDPEIFVKITKAYKTLTDETSRKNWEEYGHPEGPRAASFGIALPSWIVEKENSFIVLGLYCLLFMVALPVSVGLWWYRSVKFGCDKVLLITSELFYYFIHKTPHMALKRVIMIVSASFEFAKAHNSQIVERPSDNVEVPKLMRELANLNEKNQERPLCYSYSVKTRAIVHAHLSRLKLPANTLELDRIYIVKTFPYLVAEFVNAVAQLITLAMSGRLPNTPALVTLENAMKLSPLIVQALWDFQSPLLQLPYISDENLKLFSKKNIKSLEDLARLNKTERRDLLKSFSDEQFGEIEFVLSQFPVVKTESKFEVLDDEEPGLITAGAIVTVTVKLVRSTLLKKEEDKDDSNKESAATESNKLQPHCVHCPYFPAAKPECWWVYTVDRKRLSLVTAPLLVSNLVDSQEVELKFTAPMKPLTYSYTIVVRSDSYMDCVSQKNVVFEVKPAKAIDTGQMYDDIEDEVEFGDEASVDNDSDLATDTDEE